MGHILFSCKINFVVKNQEQNCILVSKMSHTENTPNQKDALWFGHTYHLHLLEMCNLGCYIFTE